MQTTDEKTGNTMLLDAKRKFVISHSVDLGERLKDAEAIIRFVYGTNFLSRRPKDLPEQFQHTALHESSISGILWYCARRDRPKKMYEPFFIVYGNKKKDDLLIHDADAHVVYCRKEDNLRLPAPEQLTHKSVIRWVVVEERKLTYYCQDRIVLEFPTGEAMPPQDEEETKPYNINDMPNAR